MNINLTADGLFWFEKRILEPNSLFVDAAIKCHVKLTEFRFFEFWPFHTNSFPNSLSLTSTDDRENYMSSRQTAIPRYPCLLKMIGWTYSKHHPVAWIWPKRVSVWKRGHGGPGPSGPVDPASRLSRLDGLFAFSEFGAKFNQTLIPVLR